MLEDLPPAYSMISVLPPEIVSHILEWVMFSETPFDISAIFRSHWRPWIPADQSSHVQDWIIATSVCHQFSEHGKRAFFSQKIFTVPADLLGQYPVRSGAPLDTTKWHQIRDLLFAQARRIVAPMSACTPASSFMTIPSYQSKFTNLQCLIIWPETDMKSPYDAVPAPDSEKNQREPASRELLGLLQGICVDVDRVKIDIVHSREERLRRTEVAQMEQSVFPYLRLQITRGGDRASVVTIQRILRRTI